MPNPGSSEVGQRRFWNALADQPGVIYIASWGSLDDRSALYADGELVYTGSQLATGILPFPTWAKLARYWRFEYNYSTPAGGSSDWDGTNEWIFKPYSSDMALVGPNSWMRGADWNTANLFYDASPFKVDENGDNATTLHAQMVCNASSTTYGFGGGGLAYGYLNNHYFGHNEMGGNKPNEGVGPKASAVIDLSKEYVGFWGAFGISHGVATSDYSVKMTVEFDLCDRAELAATSASLSLEVQSEGWGTDTVNITMDPDGSRHFVVPVTPARGSLRVYTPAGKQLFEGTHYVPDDCDRSGRYFRMLYDPQTPCGGLYRLVLQYLVVSSQLQQGKKTARLVDVNEGHDRLRNLDIRGFG
jgi:hypothetical protein